MHISRGDKAASRADLDGPKEGISWIRKKDVLLVQEATECLKYSCYCDFLIRGKVIGKSPDPLRIRYVTGFVPAQIGLAQLVQQIKS